MINSYLRIIPSYLINRSNLAFMFKFSFGANLWIRSGLSSTSGSTSTCLLRANQRGQTTKRGFLKKIGYAGTYLNIHL